MIRNNPNSNPFTLPLMNIIMIKFQKKIRGMGKVRVFYIFGGIELSFGLTLGVSVFFRSGSYLVGNPPYDIPALSAPYIIARANITITISK